MDTFPLVLTLAAVLAVGLGLGTLIGVLWSRSRPADDPAMAALWARATSLSPLVKCFPDDVWTESIKRVVCLYSPRRLYILIYNNLFE